MIIRKLIHMKKFILLNTIIFSFFSYSCLAVTGETTETQSYIHQLAFLSDGFNMKNYSSCKTLIANKCPAKSATPDCADGLLKEPVCGQLEKLSQTIGAQMSSVSVKQNGKVMMVSQSFIADGQAEYYIITPSNQLIDTNIDPLKLNTMLKQKYQNVSLLPVHWGKAKVKLSQNKQQIFDFSMKAHDTCMACRVVVSYDLRFAFDKSGKFIDVKLRNIRN